jgi:hypothetical protein
MDFQNLVRTQSFSLGARHLDQRNRALAGRDLYLPVSS